MKNFSFKLIAVLALSVISFAVKAQTYYYIGGDGATANFLSAAYWSSTIGGPAVGSISSANATYIIDGSDVSSTAGVQPGTSVTFSLNANTAMGNLIVQNNNISVTITSVNYTFGISNDITINTGCTLSNQISQPAIIGGNMVNNGTLTYGTSSGEYTFNGTNKTISGSNTTQFRKIIIAAGATIALQRNIELISANGSVTSFINGTLDAQTYTIAKAGSVSMNITLAATGLLRTTNPLGVRGQAGATIDPNLTLNMTSGNTIEFSALSGTQDVWCGNGTAYYYNVIISGGGIKRLVNGSATYIDIRGSLTINSGNTLDASATQDATNIKNIQFSVNFTNNGTFTARTGKVIINGSGTQVLTMNGSTLYDLELANPTTDGTSLGSDATVTHSLIFTNGRMLLGNYNFTFDVNATTTNTATTLKMLVTNGNGEVKKVIPAGGQQFTYPFGDNVSIADFTPVTLNFTANSIQRTIGCRVVDAQHPNDGSSASYISRYWHFSESPTGGSYTYNATFNFNSSTDLVTPYQPMLASYIYLPNTTWIGIPSTPTASLISVTGTSQSLNGAEVTGRISAGCTPPNQPAAFTTSTTTVCAGTNGVTYTVPNDPSVTYTWSYSGTGATINGSGNSVTVNFAANATGGDLSVTAVNGCSSTPRTISIAVNQAVGTPSFSAGATTLCAGATSTYTATAANSSGITYSILNNTGASINSTTGVVSNVTGSFTVRATATGICGSPTTADRVVTVSPAVGTPTFISGPTSLCAGVVDTYTATASNSTGITYSIVGNTGASINPTTGVVSNVTGNFTVRATAIGACGSPTTVDRQVTVNVVTAITQEPVSQSVCLHESAMFMVSSNDANANYQWYFNNNPIGTNSPVLVVNNVTSLNEGVYSVTVTGNCGADISNTVTLSQIPNTIVVYTEEICNGSSYSLNGTEYFTAGTYYDTLQSVLTGCDSILKLELTVNGPTATITVTNDINFDAGNFSAYQWLFNGGLINGATSSTYTATQNGNYSVIVTDANGCKDTSAVVNVTTLSISEEQQLFTIYPNPATHNIFIKAENLPVGKYTLTLTDVAGRILSQRTMALGAVVNERIDITGLAKGLYMLTISTNNLKQSYRIVKAE